jgi:type I pullulanase
MKKRLAIYSSLAISMLILAGCQQPASSSTKTDSSGTSSAAASSQGASSSAVSSSSAQPVAPTWTADTTTYTFPTPVPFSGAESLPETDHVVVFCPVASGYTNVYLWDGKGADGKAATLPTGSSSWPGIAMSEKYDENWYKVDLTGVVSTNIIFNASVQTKDMAITHKGYWWFWTSDGDVHDTTPVKDWVDTAMFASEGKISVIANHAVKSFKLYEGNDVLLSGDPLTQGFSVNFNDHKADVSKPYRVECSFEGATEAYEKAVDVHLLFNTDTFNNAFAYSGNDLGVTYTASQSTFKVWSPVSSDLKVRVYANGTPTDVDATKGSDVYDEYPMSKGEKGVWSAEVSGDLNAKYYTYVVTNASYNAKEVVDPYAKAVGVNGRRGEILDLTTTNPEGWSEVQTNVVDRKALTVWECHIADLTSSATWTGTEANRKKYAGFHESGTTYTSGETTVKTGFDHVKELGVNAVQILPMFDQDNDEVHPSFNWGYNPLNYNAPEGVYSSNPYDGAVRIKELKSLIADYTKAGINIIMDVVYNHVASAQASNFQALMPGYYFRYNKLGNFSNGSGCGNETASEHAMMRKFIVDSATYWAKEYKLGGFRFDLMGLHDLETMNAVEASCKNVLPSIAIYGEPWAGGDPALDGSLLAKQANGNSYVGYGQFNDGMRDALIKGGMNPSNAQGWVTDMDNPHKDDLHNITEGLKGTTDSATIIADPDKTVNYAACHDNYTLFDRVVAAVGRYDDRWTKQMTTLANAVVFTSQGTSFMLSGDEFARTKGGNSNSYNASYKVNELDYALKITNASMFASYQKLIALKQKVDGLHLAASAANALSISTSGDNEIVITLSDSVANKTYKVVHANGYGTPAAVDFSGYSSIYLDTLASGATLSSSTAIKNYQTLIAEK